MIGILFVLVVIVLLGLEWKYESTISIIYNRDQKPKLGHDKSQRKTIACVNGTQM
jgi:hypothetical protein